MGEDHFQELTEQDIVQAMQAMEGYIDITPADFRKIYQRAYCHAWERLNRSLRAYQIMTRTVVSVHPETPLSDAARLMATHHISGVLVVDQQEHLVGIISEKDFLRHMGATEHNSFMAVVADYLTTKGCITLDLKNQPAKTIMTSPAISIDTQATAHEIALLMTRHGINRLPVVDAYNKPVGILSRTDLIRSTHLEEAPCPTS